MLFLKNLLSCFAGCSTKGRCELETRGGAEISSEEDRRTAGDDRTSQKVASFSLLPFKNHQVCQLLRRHELNRCHHSNQTRSIVGLFIFDIRTIIWNEIGINYIMMLNDLAQAEYACGLR